MELYVHIPFCMRKCRYCDFLSFPISDVGIKIREKYTEALIRELYSYRDVFGSEKCDSVFIGGGTPSVLEPYLMEQILCAIDEVCLYNADDGIEYTIECNPGTVDREKLMLYKRHKINRISFGLQSACDQELLLLGRIHTYAEFFQSFILARECGFENINIDLISAIPGQSAGSWEETLRKTAELRPEHISAYSLIIEPGTPFWDEYGEESERIAKGYDNPFCAEQHRLPSEEEERLMYRLTSRVLEEYGYGRYEISNYSLPGKECRHNLGYWTGVKYAGIGLGASSYTGIDRAKEMIRYHNTDSLEDYLSGINGIRHVDESLGRKELMSEFVILHLRLVKGFMKKEFSEIFGIDVYEIFGAVFEKYKRLGLLKDENGFISLSVEGLDVSNTVMSELLL